ncbi:DUF1492 domain-containing protein [Cohnella panacarvi]|uniref:DUF1492 domain-containing protein n=1 Tax=Cohnella panacarvi TaxID=400776 RepID=UPI00047C9BD8|nr:DUF1492 domain-containing protein [Cohnella panacarvi]
MIEQLMQYRQMQARLNVLSTYSVGMGITVSRLNEDDQLQELHRRLRNLPSYKYLSSKEQKLETTAHAYLGGRYPTGIRSQQRAIPRVGADEEDDKLLEELREKIAKVIAARGYEIRDDIDAVLERLAEYQDLQAEIKRIDNVLAELKLLKPDYEKLLRLKYIEGLSVENICKALSVVEMTYKRWRKKAIEEFEKLII